MKYLRSIKPQLFKLFSEKWKRVYLTVLSVIFILSSVFFYFPPQKVEAISPWYDYDWHYRKAITVDNTGNVDELTDYQVQVDFNNTNFDFSKAESDGSDIRFTDSDATILIPYWIENWDAVGETAVLWSKVPSILASSTKTIYMYYGNSNAESASSGTGTFDFYDGFDDPTLDETPILTFGVIGDIHHTLTPFVYPNIGDNSARIQAFVTEMNSREASFVVANGDNVHNLSVGTTPLNPSDFANNLDDFKTEITGFNGAVYYDLGNHDVLPLNKSDIISRWNDPAQDSHIPSSYYYFDYSAQNYRFIVLDSQYNLDGTDKDASSPDYSEGFIPAAEQTWLTNTLSDAASLGYKAIIFNHQKITETGLYGISNSATVRPIIAGSGIVSLVI